MPQTYEVALEKSRAATREFFQAQDDYRDGKTTAVEFCAAKAKHDAALAEFDVAYAAEQGRA